MSFKDMVAAANKKVFLNAEHFADLRTVKYDGETYTDIPIILAKVKQEGRRTVIIENGRRDNTQGLYQVTAVLRCAISDLGGNKPEQGQQIKINDEEGGGGYFWEYTVATSDCDMGMLRVELEAIDE